MWLRTSKRAGVVSCRGRMVPAGQTHDVTTKCSCLPIAADQNCVKISCSDTHVSDPFRQIWYRALRIRVVAKCINLSITAEKDRVLRSSGSTYVIDAWRRLQDATFIKTVELR